VRRRRPRYLRIIIHYGLIHNAQWRMGEKAPKVPLVSSVHCEGVGVPRSQHLVDGIHSGQSIFFSMQGEKVRQRKFHSINATAPTHRPIPQPKRMSASASTHDQRSAGLRCTSTRREVRR